MKPARLFYLFIYLALFASCQIHQNNFSKRKFLDLKKLNSKEIVELNSQEDIDNADLVVNSDFSQRTESIDVNTNLEIEVAQSADVEMSNDQTHLNQKEKKKKSENEIKFYPRLKINQLVEVSKKEIAKPRDKTSEQLFKLSALIFLLGLLLIMMAMVGLFKSKMSEAGAFVSFMLGLISLIISAIYSIVGTSKVNPDKPRKANKNRRDLVIFFSLFFVAMTALFISGNV